VSLSTPLIEQIFEQSSVSVVLLSDRAIRKLNNDYRDIDKATDVLSFPLDLTCPAVGDWLLGELFISVERAAQQAEDYGHSMRVNWPFFLLMGFCMCLALTMRLRVTKKKCLAIRTKF
jgi:probable rRNA maturation factor